VNVVVFNPSYPPMSCGIGGYTRGLAEAMTAAGHDVAVMTSAAGGIQPATSPDVRPVLRDWNVTEYLRALREVRRRRPDVVIGQYPALNPGRYARLLYLLPPLAKATLPRARVVFVVHEFQKTDETARRWLSLAFRAADDIVAVTEGERAAVAARYPFARSKLRVVGLASNVAPVAASEGDLAALRRDTVGEDARVIFFFGLLRSPDKGFDDLLDALEALGDERVFLLSSGERDDADPYEAAVGRRIAERGLGERVRWLGYLDDDLAARWLRAADVVALPFRGGVAAKNTTLVAALVNGAVVLTTRGPDTPEYLVDGENVLLVEPRSPAQLANALRRALGSGELRERLRAGARALGSRFDWPAVARAILAGGAR